MSILQGVRVIEVSGSGTAAMAAKHFADWGADVLIIEPPGGTPLRRQPPCYEKDGEVRGATWQWLSRGKSAIEVGRGLDAEGARAQCLGADLVLLESELCPAVLGLEPVEVREFFEGRTTCVLVSPFAPDGPYASYRATDLGINALGGWVNLGGDPGREPIRPGYDILARLAGIYAVVASLAALRHARQGGAPQYVDLSGQAAAATLIVTPWLMKSMLGVELMRSGNRWLGGGAMECGDGWLGCTPLTATHWEMMCRMMVIEDVLDEPGGMEPPYRDAHSAELHERVRPWLMSHSKLEIFEEAQAWRIPAAPVEDVAERLADPHLAARGFFLEQEVDGRTVKVPRAPCTVKGITPAPRAALKEVTALPAPRAAAERRSDATPGRPFAGIRVLDLTHFWAGPSATTCLGALGADVIKVESVQRPDIFRYSQVSSALDYWWERGALWHDTNCSKRGLTLDLGSARGRELFDRLVPQADVVISNFSNRVMKNLGYTDERLLELNPRIIIATLPGYGPGGPWEEYVGYGIAFEQLAVCASINGYRDGPPRIMSGFCDPISGMHMVASLELALQLRDQTGKGTTVEAPQCEIVDSLFGPEHIAVQHGAPVPVRRGNEHEWMAPHNSYPVQGDDRWITIAVATDGEFRALCRVLGLHAEAADARLATVASRKANEAALNAAVGAATLPWDGRELETALQAAGVMACRVVRGYELPGDEGMQHLGYFQYLDRPISGRHPYKTWPFRFSSIDASHTMPPPTIGQHNAELLHSLLGLSPDEVARLAKDRVIGTVPLGLMVGA